IVGLVNVKLQGLWRRGIGDVKIQVVGSEATIIAVRLRGRSRAEQRASGAERHHSNTTIRGGVERSDQRSPIDSPARRGLRAEQRASGAERHHSNTTICGGVERSNKDRQLIRL